MCITQHCLHKLQTQAHSIPISVMKALTKYVSMMAWAWEIEIKQDKYVNPTDKRGLCMKQWCSYSMESVHAPDPTETHEWENIHWYLELCIFYGNKDKSSGIQYSWFPPTLLGPPYLRTPSHENMVFWEAEMKLESLLLFWQSFPQICFLLCSRWLIFP